MKNPFQTDSVQNANTSQGPSGDDGYTVLSYIIAGPLFYGGLGWLGDKFFSTSFLLPIGLVFGLAASIYLIIRRYGGAA